MKERTSRKEINGWKDEIITEWRTDERMKEWKNGERIKEWMKLADTNSNTTVNLEAWSPAQALNWLLSPGFKSFQFQWEAKRKEKQNAAMSCHDLKITSPFFPLSIQTSLSVLFSGVSCWRNGCCFHLHDLFMLMICFCLWFIYVNDLFMLMICLC